jgi:CRP-like cAMP-binding protein
LRRLSEDDYESLAPSLTRVDLALKHDLTTVGNRISHVYFVESGMVSLIAEVPNSEAIEVGMIGKEGLTDQVYEEGDIAALRCTVQMAGSAMAVEADEYARWIKTRPNAMKIMNRYQASVQIQLPFTALSHGSFNIEERLARWLLMSFDRADGNEIPLVHQFLAVMLAVRRSGVTTALHVLEGHLAIKASRGKIILRDRETLESLAQGSYGFPEREYQRLLGPLPD